MGILARGASRTVFVAAVALVMVLILVAAYLATRPSPGEAPEESPAPTTPAETTTPAQTSPAAEASLTPAKEEKTIVIYASLSEMTTADPSTEFSNSIIWMPLVYEPLVWYDPLEDRLIPGLAVEWESSDNGTVWTFRLRENAKFHDGTPVTAEAVKMSIERTIALGQGAAFIWDPVDRIEVLDDYTVRFYLKYPAPLAHIAAASYGAWIFSPNIVKYAGASNLTDPKVADWFNQGNEAGSGPYRLVKWDPENEVVLEKWEEWWGWREPGYEMASPNAPDVFIIKIVKDAVTQERLLLTGDIDIAQYVPLENVDRFEKDPGFVVAVKPSFQDLLMLINTKKPPLDNPLVRKAIALAIPYEDIVEVARAGVARVASGPIPHGMWGHFEDFTYEYNLEEARKLLAQAGYPDGIDRTLLLVYTAGDIYEKRTAELIKTSLAKIGIQVEVRPMSWEEQWSLALSGWDNPEAAQDLFIFYWWPTYITPFDFLYNMFHSENTLFNLAYYQNPEFDKLIEEAVLYEGYDRERALSLYYEAQKILYEDVPAVPLWDSVDVRVANARIGNLEKAINPAYPTTIFAQVLSVEG